MALRRELLTLPIADDLWTVGYDWLVAGNKASLQAQAAAEASTTAADVIVYRRDSSEYQYGLGYLAPDDRANGMAAASAFAGYLSLARKTTNGIGLFRLPGDHWWLIEIDESTIDPDSDSVYTDQAEAEAAFASRLHSRYWNHLFVPASLIETARRRLATATEEQAAEYDQILTRSETPNSLAPDTTPLEAILGGRTGERYGRRAVRAVRRADIRRFVRHPLVLGIAGVAAVALLVVYGVVPAMRHWTAKPVQVAQPVLPPPPPPTPIITTPMPSITAEPVRQWLAQCYDDMASIADRTPPGWVAAKLQCAPGGTTGQILRDVGTLADLDKAYPGALLKFPDPANYGTASVTLPRISGQAVRDERPAPREALRRDLVTLGWRLDEKITVAPFAPPPGRAAANDRATWQQAEVTITSQVSPLHWAAALAPYPGIVLTELTIDASALGNEQSPPLWTIRGTIYAE
jgi:hypothetical protein